MGCLVHTVLAKVMIIFPTAFVYDKKKKDFHLILSDNVNVRSLWQYCVNLPKIG